MQIVSLFLLIFTSSLNAQVTPTEIALKRTNKVFSYINGKHHKVVNSCSQKQTSEEHNPVTNKLSALKCIRKICGAEEDVENYQEMIDKASEMDAPPTDKKFEEEYMFLVNKLIDAEIKYKKTLAPQFKKIKDNADYLQPEVLKIVNLPISILTDSLYYDFGVNTPIGWSEILSIDEENGTYSINIKKQNLEKNAKLMFPKNQLMQSTYKEIASSPFYLSFYLSTNGIDLPAPSLIGMLEKEDDWRKAFDKLIDRSKDNFQTLEPYLKKKLGNRWDKAKEDIGYKTIEEYDRGIYPDANDLKSKLEMFYLLEIIRKQKDKKNLDSILSNINIRDQVLAKIPSNYSYSKDLNFLDDPKMNYAKKKKLDILGCKANMTLTLNALPTEKEVQEFNQNNAKYKRLFKSKLFNRFSHGPGAGSNSAMALGRELDQLPIVAPISKEKYKSNILQKMKRKLSDFEANIQVLNKNEDNQTISLISLQEFPSDDESILSYEYDDDGNRTNIISGFSDELHYETVDLCEKYTPQPLNDSFWPFKLGSVKVSWNSIKSKHFGESVLFHELGHAISPFFQDNSLSKESSEAYNNARSCLNTNHENGDSTLYTEEDWADLVSALLMSEKRNVGCFLLSQENGKYSDLHLTNENAEDSHASELYRILQIQLYSKGSYPDECRALVIEQSDTEESVPSINCSKMIQVNSP